MRGSTPAEPPCSLLRCVTAAAWTLGLLLFAFSLALAYRRPLWFDEYATLYIARGGSFAQMAAAVRSGADTIPPYFHWLESWILRSGLTEPVALRLLPALGITIGFLCLFYSLRPACGALAALAGAMLPLAADAMRFAWEARPYGIVFGMTAVAGLAWHRAGISKVSPLVLCGTLAAATLFHPFAIVATAAIACAELLVSLRRKSWRIRVWIALITAGTAGLADYEFLQTARNIFAPHFFAPSDFFSVYLAYRELFLELWPLLVWIALWPALLHVLGDDPFPPSAAGPNERVSEDAGGGYRPSSEIFLGFALLVVVPALTWLALRSSGGGLVSRYILLVTMGAGILWASILARFGSQHRLAAVFCLFLIVFVKANASFREVNKDCASSEMSGVEEILRPAASGRQGTVVISDAEIFLQCWRMAPPWMKKHLVYVSDPMNAVKYVGTDSVERTMLGLSSISGAPVIGYEKLVKNNPRFTVVAGHYTRMGGFQWLIPRLLEEGCRLTLEMRRDTFELFAVSCGPEAADTADR